MSLETKKPLADYAPRTYRQLKLRELRELARALDALAGPDEKLSAALLIAEDVTNAVKQADEPIEDPEEFAAGVLQYIGVASAERYKIILGSTADLPVVEIAQEEYVLDFSARRPLTSLADWPSW